MLKSITLSICLIIIFTSCEKYYYIPEQLKPIIEDGQVVKFSNDVGSIDSMQLKVTYSFSNSDKRYNRQEISIRYFSFQNGVKADSDYLRILQGVCCSFVSSKGMGFDDVLFDRDSHLLSTSYLLGSIELTRVYKLRILFPQNDPSEVDEVYYSPQYGIVQYTLQNGQTFKLKY